jgi:group II intron reverse transcriptase/maturase
MNVRKMTNAMLKQKAERFSTTLYQCAKANPKRKFHALYDKIYRPDILKSAWLRVKDNKGSAGIDGITIDEVVNEIGESTFLNDLYKKLKTETYRPSPVKRVWIPKTNSEKMRPLGIPTIEDRVVQQATKMILEPIFETTFKDTSYGFRPGRNAHQAMKAIRKASKKAYWVVDIDIKGYFDNINHRKLMLLVEQKISDKRVLKLIRNWLKAGVMEEGNLEATEIGSPQGGVISPLLANIYLNVLDHLWEKRYKHLGDLVRYADDMVVMTKTKRDAIQAWKALNGIFHKLEIEINREKSNIVNIWDDQEGFDFLGFHNRKFPRMKKGGKIFYFMEHIPKKGAMKNMRSMFKEYITPRNRLYWDTLDFIPGLNSKIRGLKNYYDISVMSVKWLARIDWYIRELLLLHYNKRRTNQNKRSNWKTVKELLDGKLLKLA